MHGGGVSRTAFIRSVHSVDHSFVNCYDMRGMIERPGICAFPGCAQPVAPPPLTGGRSRYCVDPGHNPTTAYRARHRPPSPSGPDDPAALRERFERDLARLERTLAEAREVLARPDPSARIAELEDELAVAVEARAAAEAARARAVEQARAANERADRAGTTAREWFHESAGRVEQAEAERDAALARAAEAEARAEQAEAGRQAAEDRAYAAESAWRTLDWQLAEQLSRAEKAEAALRELRGEATPPPEDSTARNE
jgi:hypothetical protein